MFHIYLPNYLCILCVGHCWGERSACKAVVAEKWVIVTTEPCIVHTTPILESIHLLKRVSCDRLCSQGLLSPQESHCGTAT
ncbi:hypothetical protein EV363DRAFT_579226 [Boletus edulis]|nr:hypothetical protein EV363DRAFT_579226 [Boletus edulis]